jgi:hypothetical protein
MATKDRLMEKEGKVFVLRIICVNKCKSLLVICCIMRKRSVSFSLNLYTNLDDLFEV